MGNTFYFGFEPQFMIWLQSFLGEGGAVFAEVLTFLGEKTLLVGILAFLYLCYDKKMGEFVGVNILCGIVWNAMIKNVVLRRRPYFDHKGIKCLRAPEPEADIYDVTAQGYSFPSGHSANSALAYGSLAYYERESKLLAIIAIALPLLVGVSRVALGVHYPTDVLAGWGLGAIIILGISPLQRRVKNRHLFHLVLVLVSLPGIFFCKTEDYFTSLGIMLGFFAALPFEERFVNFKETRKPLKVVLRVAGAFGIYLGLNMILKAPFPTALLEDATPAAFAIRTVRYFIVVFTIVGIYPLVFDKYKIGEKK